MRIQLLGRPLIDVDGERRRLAGRKPWALLAFLLLESTVPSRRELAERFWPEADDPLAAVRWALLQVRRAIAPELVEEVDGRFAIANRAALKVDADSVVSGRADPADVDVLASAELLEGFAFDEAPDLDRWLTFQRSRLRSASAETLLWAATILATRDPGRAAVLAERAAVLGDFPWRPDDTPSVDRLFAPRRGTERAVVDNPWQLPGEFVIAEGGRIVLAHRYQYCEDFPPLTVLLGAIRAAPGNAIQGVTR